MNHAVYTDVSVLWRESGYRLTSCSYRRPFCYQIETSRKERERERETAGLLAISEVWL